MDKIDTTYIKHFTEDILDLLEVKGAVSVDDKKDQCTVTIDGENLGMVIGRHGDTLNSLQHIVNVAAVTKYGDDYKHVVVEAGSWRKNRELDLKDMSDRAIKKVRETGREHHFPPMNAADRRTLHVLFTENDEFIAESEGEGRDRHLVLKIKDE